MDHRSHISPLLLEKAADRAVAFLLHCLNKAGKGYLLPVFFCPMFSLQLRGCSGCKAFLTPLHSPGDFRGFCFSFSIFYEKNEKYLLTSTPPCARMKLPVKRVIFLRPFSASERLL